VTSRAAVSKQLQLSSSFGCMPGCPSMHCEASADYFQSAVGCNCLRKLRSALVAGLVVDEQEMRQTSHAGKEVNSRSITAHRPNVVILLCRPPSVSCWQQGPL